MDHGPRTTDHGPRTMDHGPWTMDQVPSPHRRHAALLDQLCHERGPSRLVRRAEPGAVVAVKILVKRDEVAPVWIALEALLAAEHGAAPVVAHEDADQPPRQLHRHVPERQHPAGSGRILDGERRS